MAIRYSHRFFLWAPVTVLVGLFAAAVIHWFIAADAFAKYLDRANGHEIARGVTLHFAHRQIAGFPFRIDAVIADMSVKFAGANGPVTWRTEHFAMHMLDYGRVQAIFEAAGKQTVDWTGDDHKKDQLQFTPALLRASAIDAHGRLSRFDFELVAAASSRWQIANLQFHLRRDADADALDIVLNGDDMHLSPGLKSAFGNALSRLRLNATLAPASALDAVMSGKSDWRAAAENWRKRGGSLAITNLDIGWGKADATGSGMLMIGRGQTLQGLIDFKVAGIGSPRTDAAKGFFERAVETIAKTTPNAQGKIPMRLAFNSGLIFVNQTPAGFLDRLY